MALSRLLGVFMVKFFSLFFKSSSFCSLSFCLAAKNSFISPVCTTFVFSLGGFLFFKSSLVSLLGLVVVLVWLFLSQSCIWFSSVVLWLARGVVGCGIGWLLEFWFGLGFGFIVGWVFWFPTLVSSLGFGFGFNCIISINVCYFPPSLFCFLLVCWFFGGFKIIILVGFWGVLVFGLTSGPMGWFSGFGFFTGGFWTYGFGFPTSSGFWVLLIIPGFLDNNSDKVGCPSSFKYFFPLWFGFPFLVWFGVTGFGFGCCRGFPPSITIPNPLTWSFSSGSVGLVLTSLAIFTIILGVGGGGLFWFGLGLVTSGLVSVFLTIWFKLWFKP